MRQELGLARAGRSGFSARRKRSGVLSKRRLFRGISIARVTRENGVNANQVFQWRHEHRQGIGWACSQPRAWLLPVTVAAEPDSVVLPEATRVAVSTGSTHIELPGRALVSVESGADPALVRAVLGSLTR